MCRVVYVLRWIFLRRAFDFRVFKAGMAIIVLYRWEGGVERGRAIGFKVL